MHQAHRQRHSAKIFRVIFDELIEDTPMTQPFEPSRIIARKRDGGELTPEELAAVVARYVSGDLPDYQMAALAMAICIRGMTTLETAALTELMLRSGDVLHWNDDGRPVVDKHSTGGIGDKTSLILAPLLACCGMRVPMVSGRGLGPTGGTLDKLESIPGFCTNLSQREIVEITNRVGCVITGATENLVPADRKLYALRDVTGTVESIPLITASIMSKKLAESLDALVLDVKFGSGAFMKTREQATELARSMVETGGKMNVSTTALLTDMNQPLGRMAGNAVEVNECLETLRGEGPLDLRELTLALAAELLVLANPNVNHQEAMTQLETALDSGTAYNKFVEMVTAQGGNLNTSREIAKTWEITAEQPGIVAAIDAEQIGWAIIQMGGGRKSKTDAINHAVGLEMLVRISDAIVSGQPLVRVFFDPQSDREREEVSSRIRKAIQIADQPVATPKLIVNRITTTADSPEKRERSNR